MSVDWGLVPSQPENPGFCEWLASAGVAVPERSGRYPTYDELIDVLGSFKGMPVDQHQDNDNLYTITLRDAEAGRVAHMMGSVQEDGLFGFGFFGYSTDEFLMFQIAAKVSESCGPMVLYERMAVTPVVIEPTIDIESSFEDWQARQRKRIGTYHANR